MSKSKLRAPLIENSVTEIFRVSAPDVKEDQFHISFEPPISPDKFKSYDATGGGQHPITATVVDDRGFIKKLVYQRNVWGWNEKHRGRDFKNYQRQFTRRMGYNTPPKEFTHIGKNGLVAAGVHVEMRE